MLAGAAAVPFLAHTEGTIGGWSHAARERGLRLSIDVQRPVVIRIDDDHNVIPHAVTEGMLAGNGSDLVVAVEEPVGGAVEEKRVAIAAAIGVKGQDRALAPAVCGGDPGAEGEHVPAEVLRHIVVGDVVVDAVEEQPVAVAARGRRGAGRAVPRARRLAAGAVLERGRRLREVVEQLRVVRRLPPVGDHGVHLLGQAVDPAGGRLGHAHRPGHHLLLLRVEDEVLGRDLRGADGAVHVQQPLGVAIEELVLDAGPVGEGIARADDEVGGVGAALRQLFDLLEGKRPVKDEHLVNPPVHGRGSHIPGSHADAQGSGVETDGPGAGSDSPSFLTVDVAHHVPAALPGHRQMGPGLGGDGAPLSAMGGPLAVPDFRAQPATAHRQEVPIRPGRPAHDALIAGRVAQPDPGRQRQLVFHAQPIGVRHLDGVVGPVKLGGVPVPAVVPGRRAAIAATAWADAVVGVAGIVAEGAGVLLLVQPQQQQWGILLARACVECQNLGIGPDLRVESKGLLLEVGQLVQVRVHAEGVGRDPGAQLAAVRREVVDELPAIDLLLIRQPVVVGVRPQGVGGQDGLLAVVQAIVVAVGVAGVAALLQLEEVGQAVVVAVPIVVVGVSAVVHHVAQSIPVGVLEAREGGVAVEAPGQRVATLLLGQVVESVERGREDIVGDALSQVDVAGVLDGANVADGNEQRCPWQPEGPALLGRKRIALRQIEAERLVDARLLQRHRRLGGGDQPGGFVARPLPVAGNVAPFEALVDVLLPIVQLVVEGRRPEGILAVLPPVGAGFPVVVGVGPIDQPQVVCQCGLDDHVVAHRQPLVGIDEALLELIDVQPLPPVHTHHDVGAVDRPQDSLAHHPLDAAVLAEPVLGILGRAGPHGDGVDQEDQGGDDLADDGDGADGRQDDAGDGRGDHAGEGGVGGQAPGPGPRVMKLVEEHPPGKGEDDDEEDGSGRDALARGLELRHGLVKALHTLVDGARNGGGQAHNLADHVERLHDDVEGLIFWKEDGRKQRHAEGRQNDDAPHTEHVLGFSQLAEGRPGVDVLVAHPAPDGGIDPGDLPLVLQEFLSVAVELVTNIEDLDA